MDVIGVDFSGAKEEGKTWVTEGHMTMAGCLVIDRILPILRDDLIELLQNAHPSTVVALDFPFGLPRAFLESIGVRTDAMDEVWPKIAAMSRNDYEAKCKNFGSHPKRIGDKLYSVSISALNTRLVPMTYFGMKMLKKLREANTDRWWIPPLDTGQMPPDRITLLEVMPGAFLWSIGFDWATLKGPQGYKRSLDTRDRLVDQLCGKATIEIPNLPDFRWGFRANDDCLDSAIAALAAASWATHQDSFLHPQEDEWDDAQLEGWLYALGTPPPNPEPPPC